jgi:hypothetical protein
MHRRQFLVAAGLFLSGCRGKQFAQVLSDNKQDMVGSHAAGAETFKPLIDESVGKLLSRQSHISPVAATAVTVAQKRICFVGVENKSCEELGDFKDQIYEIIDNRIVESQVFQPVSRRYVEAGLREARLRPDELFVPAKRTQFQAIMEQAGQPFDYLLYATITSGTTRTNADYQRDYLLTLELVNVHTGDPDKECATIRKGYHHSRLSRLTS